MNEMMKAVWKVRGSNEAIKALVAKAKVYSGIAAIFAEESELLAEALKDKLDKERRIT